MQNQQYCYVSDKWNKKHIITIESDIVFLWYAFPWRILWVVLQLSLRTKMVDALHCLCWSFPLFPVVAHKESSSSDENKTREHCNHNTHCGCCCTRSSRHNRVWMSEKGVTGVSSRDTPRGTEEVIGMVTWPSGLLRWLWIAVGVNKKTNDLYIFFSFFKFVLVPI